MFQEKRSYPRFKRSVSVEVRPEGSDAPVHCNTADISLGGCYIESMYPMEVGTSLELKLQLDDTLLILAKVVTRDPQFGNGIQFQRMLPEDLEQLSRFLDSCATQESGETARR